MLIFSQTRKMLNIIQVSFCSLQNKGKFSARTKFFYSDTYGGIKGYCIKKMDFFSLCFLLSFLPVDFYFLFYKSGSNTRRRL